MTWFDLILLLVVALTTALAAERRFAGLLLGAASVLLLKPLLLLGSISAVGAILTGLAAAVLLALLVRRIPRDFVPDWAGRLLGGLGGLLLSVVLVLAIVTGLPVERTAHGDVIYPPHSVARPLANALQSSPLVAVGRNILLYPLLDADDRDTLAGHKEAHTWVHEWLVPDTPWK